MCLVLFCLFIKACSIIVKAKLKLVFQFAKIILKFKEFDLYTTTFFIDMNLLCNYYSLFQLCISPAVSDIQETENTLHFGQRLQKVATKPVVNVEVLFYDLYRFSFTIGKKCFIGIRIFAGPVSFPAELFSYGKHLQPRFRVESSNLIYVII